MTEPKPWRVLSTTPVFSDAPHLEVSVDAIALPDGSVIERYYQVNSRPSCAVVASDEAGRFIMLRQYKHGARRVCLTFPGGRLEPGEALADTAQRELREETGYEAQTWRSLGRFPIHANQHVGIVELFRAERARFIVAPNSGDLEEMEVVLVSPAEAQAALKDGRIALLGDAAALALALAEAAIK